jgi:hypothetical protein
MTNNALQQRAAQQIAGDRQLIHPSGVPEGLDPESFIRMNHWWLAEVDVKSVRPCGFPASKAILSTGRSRHFEPRSSLVHSLGFPTRTVTQSNARTSAVLIDEFDAGSFQSAANCQIVSRCHGGVAFGEFSTADCAQAYG